MTILFLLRFFCIKHRSSSHVIQLQNSLSVHDLNTGRTCSYQPVSAHRESAFCDIILYGETSTVHGSEFGDYKFHGRIRMSDGKIALIRRPVEDDDAQLGVWLFSGQVYGGYDLVGNWTNTSTAKDTPSGNGWFRMARKAA